MDASKALTELRRGTVQYCVLALLRRRPMYGFELVKTLEETGGLVRSLGTIYPLLARLRADSLVTVTSERSTTGPVRRYYQITERGADVLASFVGEWRGFRDSVDLLFDDGG